MRGQPVTLNTQHDVNPAGIVDGDVPTWNATAHRYEPKARTAPGPLGILNFVEATSPAGPSFFSIATNAFTTIPLSALTDPNGLFDNTHYTYVVPVNGRYAITARIRVYDLNLWGGWADGDGFGMNVGIADVDEITLDWGLIHPSPRTNKRQSFFYQRDSTFNAGDALRLYVYIDSPASTYDISGAEVSIYQFAAA